VDERLIKAGLDSTTRVPPEVIVIPDSPAELCPELGPPPEVFTAPAPVGAPQVPSPAAPKAPPAQPPDLQPEPEPELPRPPSSRRRARSGVGYAAAFAIVAAFGATVYGVLWGVVWLGGELAQAVMRVAPYVALAVMVLALAGWALGVRLPRGRQRSVYGAPRRSGLARAGAVLGGTAHASGVAVRVGVIGVGALTRTVTRVAQGGPLRAAPDGVEIGRVTGAGQDGFGAPVAGAPLVLRDQSGAPLSPTRRTASGVPVDSARAQLADLVAGERVRRAERQAARQGMPAGSGYAAHLPGADGAGAGYAPAAEPMTLGARMLTRVFGPAEAGQESAQRSAGRDPSVEWTFSDWLYAPGSPRVERLTGGLPTEWMTDRLTERWCDRMRSAWSSEQVRGQWSDGQRMGIIAMGGPCRFCAVGFLFDESDPNGWGRDGSIFTHVDREKLFARYGQEFLMQVSDLFERGANPAQCADYVEQYYARV
jgi:hypothetical protein